MLGPYRCWAPADAGPLTMMGPYRWRSLRGYWQLITGNWLLITDYWSLIPSQLTIPSGVIVFQAPRVKSGNSTGAPPLATDCSLMGATTLQLAAS